MTNEQVKLVYGKERLDSYFEEKRKLVDDEILNLLLQETDLSLHEKIEYVLRTRGKRLRPILVMLSAQCVGGNIKSVKKLALAVELLHAATLIHDDILDQDIFRRNVPTVNARWGVRDAVLVGDALASLSLGLTAEYGEEITKIMSRTCLLLSDGEYLDVENAKKALSERDYFETIKKKSASLFKAATQCGALAFGASRDEAAALAEFGESVGLAYQIKDDLLDVTACGNNVPQDINEFRATLPIIHLCESTKPILREKFLQQLSSFKAQSPSEKSEFLKELQKALQSTGTVNYCICKVNQYIDDAVDSLESIKESIYKDFIIQVAESLRPTR
jgi:octaprenyl-diphosphate synthase